MITPLPPNFELDDTRVSGVSGVDRGVPLEPLRAVAHIEGVEPLRSRPATPARVAPVRWQFDMWMVDTHKIKMKPGRFFTGGGLRGQGVVFEGFDAEGVFVLDPEDTPYTFAVVCDFPGGVPAGASRRGHDAPLERAVLSVEWRAQSAYFDNAKPTVWAARYSDWFSSFSGPRARSAGRFVRVVAVVSYVGGRWSIDQQWRGSMEHAPVFGG